MISIRFYNYRKLSGDETGVFKGLYADQEPTERRGFIQNIKFEAPQGFDYNDTQSHLTPSVILLINGKFVTYIHNVKLKEAQDALAAAKAKGTNIDLTDSQIQKGRGPRLKKTMPFGVGARERIIRRTGLLHLRNQL